MTEEEKPKTGNDTTVLYHKKKKVFWKYRRNCKICNHKERAAIEQRIMQGDTYADIIKRENKELGIRAFPELFPANLTAHSRNHMPRAMKEVLVEQYEKHAEAQLNAVARIKEYLGKLERSISFLGEPERFRSDRDQIQAQEIQRRVVETATKIIQIGRKLEGTPTTIRGIDELLNLIEQETEEKEKEAEELTLEPKIKKSKKEKIEATG